MKLHKLVLTSFFSFFFFKSSLLVWSHSSFSGGAHLKILSRTTGKCGPHFYTFSKLKINRRLRSITDKVLNSGLCTDLFRSGLSELPESDRYMYFGQNRGIDFSVLEFICLFCIFLY